MDHPALEHLADRLIEVTRLKPGTLIDWKSLTGRLDVSVESLLEAAALARSWGYTLKVRQSRGIEFVKPPDLLSETEILHGLKTKWLGRPISAFRSVASTNDLAAQLAESGALEGSMVVAEQQTKGRGRLGRVWFSAPGDGIYVSLILRPDFAPAQAPGLSLMTAVALADAVASLGKVDVKVKWPNDVLLGGRKTAGILTELSAEGEHINHVVVGVGINVNQGVGAFPSEIRKIATSLRRAFGRKVDRVAFLQTFLACFEKEYDTYKTHHLKKAHARIRKYSSLIGKEITVKSGKRMITGLVTDIAVDGSLVMQTPDGVLNLTAGEVTVVKK
ncbi:MAG: biotin--[acetyl-CoA-carboxylase] ligase [candidate division Zixibacteria bacterium]|nr:biotin--[acetyl-CoA-carboxylase] ligase [candidate division Zixibacteria bacterium]